MLLQYHKITSGIIAVAFVVVVQAFSIPFPIFRYLIPVVVLCMCAVQLYNYFYLIELKKPWAWTLVRLTIFFVVWFGLYSLIHVVFLRGLFLVLSVGVIYLFERVLGNFGEHLILNEVLLIAWAMFLVALGLSDYFRLAAPFLLGVQFVTLLLLVRSSFSFVPYRDSVRWASALAVTLFMTQLQWAVSFLPLHYSALGMLLFSGFYVLYTLCYYALFNTLTWKRVQFHVGLATMLAVLTILATPWKVIN